MWIVSGGVWPPLPMNSVSGLLVAGFSQLWHEQPQRTGCSTGKLLEQAGLWLCAGEQGSAAAWGDFCSVLKCSLPYPLYWHDCLYSHTVNLRAEKCILGKSRQNMLFQLPVLNYQLYKSPSPVCCSVTKTSVMPSEILNKRKRLKGYSNFLLSGNPDASNIKCWSRLLTITP